VRVEAASIGNQIVYFKVFRSWDLEPGSAIAKNRRVVAGDLYAGVFFVTLGVSLILAWCNLRVGRCDRRGAWRLAVFVACLKAVLWIVEQRAASTLGFDSTSLLGGLRVTVFAGFATWIYYLALEPAVRRFWPHSIISWSRVLVGQWRDDLVGRDILVGATFGLAVVLLQQLNALLPIWTGHPSPLIFLPGNEYDLGRLTGLRYSMETLVYVLQLAVERGMLLLMLMLVLRMVLRWTWPAGLGFLLIATTIYALNTDAGSVLAWAMCAIVCGGAAIVLLRAGLLATVVSFFVTRLLVTTPITTDPRVWYAGMSGFSLLVIVALLLLGLYASLTTHLRAAVAAR
jgi:serine/threonine-protein kinase